MSPRDPPDSPPVLQRGKRAPAIAGAASTPPPPAAGTRVNVDAAIAAALPWEGDLAQDGPLRLYYLAAAAQATGRLVLASGATTYAVAFKRGVPEHAASNDPADDLGRFLVARGAVAEDRVGDAARVKESYGGDLVAALAALGALNPAESFQHLQAHAVAVLGRALALDAGRGRWEPGVAPPPSSFPLGSRFGLLCDAVRRLDALSVRRRLGGRAHRSATRVGGRIAVTDLKLSALEARVVSLFDGVRSVAEVAGGRTLDADIVHRVALLLAETELLAFGGERSPPAAAPPPSAAPQPAATPNPAAAPAATGNASADVIPATTADATPTASAAAGADATPTDASAATPSRKPPPPAPPPGQAAATRAAAPPRQPPRAEPPSAGVAAADAAALRVLEERFRGADHFAVLGVARGDSGAKVKAAYFQLAKQVHPDAAPHGERADLRQLRADLFARISEAWAVLSDDARRARYLEELAGGAAVDVAAILEAENLFVKATVHVKARQYAGALELLQQAEKLNSDEPEIQVWRAWVEFLLSENRVATHAPSAATIERALKKSPRCMAAYLFLGQMAKVIGNLDLAEKQLKRGLAQDPDHVELQRELKYLRK